MADRRIRTLDGPITIQHGGEPHDVELVEPGWYTTYRNSKVRLPLVAVRPFGDEGRFEPLVGTREMLLCEQAVACLLGLKLRRIVYLGPHRRKRPKGTARSTRIKS